MALPVSASMSDKSLLGCRQRFVGDRTISQDGPLYVTDQANAHRTDQGLYVPRNAVFFLMSDEIVNQTESRPQQLPITSQIELLQYRQISKITSLSLSSGPISPVSLPGSDMGR